MMLRFKGIIDELPQLKKYWTHMFQNKSIPVVGEYQSKVLTFSRMRNEIFSPLDNTNRETSDMIGDMTVTSAKALLTNIRDKKIHGGVSVKCWGQILMG